MIRRAIFGGFSRPASLHQPVRQTKKPSLKMTMIRLAASCRSGLGHSPNQGLSASGSQDRDPKKTWEAWQKKYEHLTLDEKIHYCIFQLRNECWFESDHFVGLGPYSTAPEVNPRRELIRFGKPAIPQLIRDIGFPCRHEDSTDEALSETLACAGCRPQCHRNHRVQAPWKRRKTVLIQRLGGGGVAEDSQGRRCLVGEEQRF